MCNQYTADHDKILYKPTVCLNININKGSGALLVRLYKDTGAPAIECSPTKF